MNRRWNTPPDPDPAPAAPVGPVVSVRCVLDAERPRPVTGPTSRVCAVHRQRLADLLDPHQGGQVFAKPGEPRTPASIPVLYRLLDPQPGRTSDREGCAPGFRSSPPGRVDVMALRDPRSVADGDVDLWSVLGTLVGVALRLDLRDIHGQPLPIPRSVEGCSGWLHLRLDALCAAGWVDDAWHDLRAVHRQLRAVAGDPAPRPVGRCWKRVDDDGQLDDAGKWECGGLLYLPPQPLKGMDEPVVLPADLRCGVCGGHYDRGEIVRVGRARKAAG